MGRLLKKILQEAKRKLQENGKKEAESDIWPILHHATGYTQLDVIKNPLLSLKQEQERAFFLLFERRLKGEPLGRILGQRSFHGLNFLLNAATLEPRDDTEAVLELLIPLLHSWVKETGCVHFVDMGTGSGAIAIAALYHVPQAYAIGLDKSAAALEMAQKNALNAGVAERFSPCLSDWFKNLTGEFSVIVSNPPYIESQHIAQLAPEVKNYDPIAALDGGCDGLRFYRSLAAESSNFLIAKGSVIVEIGFNQEKSVATIFNQHGFNLVQKQKDLCGITRALAFKKTAL